MAEQVRIDLAQCNAAASDLKNKVNEMREYINGRLNSTVNNMSSWWIGDSYQGFVEDFNQTKTILEDKICREIDEYISNLKKAVERQSQLDQSEKQSVRIN